MVKMKDRLRKTQARYRNNYDVSLRKQRKCINVDDHLYLHLQLKDTDEHRHTLTLMAEGLYKVMKVDYKTVVNEKTYRSVEKVSRSRVVMALKPKTDEEMNEFPKPT